METASEVSTTRHNFHIKAISNFNIPSIPVFPLIQQLIVNHNSL